MFPIRFKVAKSLRAFLYSDQIIPENKGIDDLLVTEIQKTSGRIGYVFSGPDPGKRFLNEKCDYYAKFSLKIALTYDLDDHNTKQELSSLLACDAIHLPGGDTLAFLKRLNISGMVPALKKWASRGGILIGTSAGAILMTPNIAVDGLFHPQLHGTDEDLASLNLLPFEFFPHFENKYLKLLEDYSQLTPNSILACPDGSGVVVNNGTVGVVGSARLFHNGRTEFISDS